VKVPVWAWVAWFAASALSFLVLESIGIWNGIPDDTLTQTTLHHLPAVLVLAAFLGFPAWLAVHFGTRVWRNRHGKQDGL
jgi:hypothetical protein